MQLVLYWSRRPDRQVAATGASVCSRIHLGSPSDADALLDRIADLPLTHRKST